MHLYSERHKQFSRRTAMLAGGKTILLSALIGRMYFLQVIESKRYKTLADENRINFRLLSTTLIFQEIMNYVALGE